MTILFPSKNIFKKKDNLTRNNYIFFRDIIPDLPNIPAGQEDYKQLSNRLGCKNSRLETTNFRA